MKFTDMLCERAPASEEELAELGACAWPPLLSPRHSPEVSPERRLRSRSSPVRTSIEEEWMQAERTRSPSASQAAPAAAADAARAHLVQASLDHYSPCQPRYPRQPLPDQPLRYLTSNGGGGAGGVAVGAGGVAVGAGRPGFARVSAYFSVRPPPLPMQLVPVEPPMPPALPAHSSTSSPPPPTSTLATHLDEERCKNAVRSVLCELMAALPLSAPSSPARRPRPSQPVRPAPPVPTAPLNSSSIHAALSAAFNAAELNRGRSPSKRVVWGAGSTGSLGSAASAAGARCVHVRHHVATQAHSSGIVRSDDGVQDRADSADEWLGGVRALRDSHVRLVLRQLRHIERLNRALDRAARTSPVSRGPPAARAASPGNIANMPTHTHVLN